MIFESLGLFETRSVSSAICALNAINGENGLKIIGKRLLGSGIVTIFVKGELGAIKNAFNLGAAEISISNDFRSSHIIPLPHKDLLIQFGLKEG